MDTNYLEEAFKRLSLLEDDFDISVDANKVDELKSFVEDDVDEIPEEEIIDVNADTEKDLSDNYIGKVILECECCHSRIYKDEADIIIDEESGLANIDEQCPVCNNELGYTVIGKIEPFNKDRDIEPEVEEDELPADDIELDAEIEDEVKESLGNRIARKHLHEAKEDVCPYCGKNPCVCESCDDESLEEDKPVKGDRPFTWKANPEAVKKVLDLIYNLPEDEFELYNDNAFDYYMDNDKEAGRIIKKIHREHNIPMWALTAFVENWDDQDLFRESLEEGIFSKKPNVRAAVFAIGGGGGRADRQIMAYSEDNKDGILLKRFADYLNEDSSSVRYTLKTFGNEGGLKACQQWTGEKNPLNNALTVDEIKRERKFKRWMEENNYSLEEDFNEFDPAERLYEVKPGEFKHGSELTNDEINALISIKKRSKRPQEIKEIEDLKSLLDEDFKEVAIKTDDQKLEMTSDENGKVTVTTEPIDDSLLDEPDDMENGEEEIVPLDAEEEASIENNSEEEVEVEEEPTEEEMPEDEEGEVDIEEFDEESFDEIGESYMRKVYSNVANYKTVKVNEGKDSIIVEGLITFNSGAQKTTRFVFDNAVVSKRGKLVLEGFNRTFTKANKSFILRGTLDGTKYITESMIYNYRVKQLNESTNSNETVRVYGRIKRK